jgi:hypothetical protein
MGAILLLEARRTASLKMKCVLWAWEPPRRNLAKLLDLRQAVLLVYVKIARHKQGK